MITHQYHYKTMEWHYDVTMDHIRMSKVIVTSQRLFIVLFNDTCFELDVLLFFDNIH